jgi:hypothetical protein
MLNVSEKKIDEISVRLEHFPWTLFTGVQGLKFQVSSLKFALFSKINFSM